MLDLSSIFQTMIEHGQLKLQEEKPRIKEDVSMHIHTSELYVCRDKCKCPCVCTCGPMHAKIYIYVCIVCGEHSTLNARNRLPLRTWV